MYVGYKYILLLNTHFWGFTCRNKRVAKFGQAKRQVGLSFWHLPLLFWVGWSLSENQGQYKAYRERLIFPFPKRPNTNINGVYMFG